MWRFRIVRVRRNRKKSLKSKKEYEEQKENARILVKEKLELWKKFYLENFNINLNYNRVSIKNSITRWGSCSSKKNLNFSYKILILNEKEQDYLIVHELCHLQQMNHSQVFWDLVALSIPDYKTIRNSMKKISLG